MTARVVRAQAGLSADGVGVGPRRHPAELRVRPFLVVVLPQSLEHGAGVRHGLNSVSFSRSSLSLPLKLTRLDRQIEARATAVRQGELAACRTMIERASERLGLRAPSDWRPTRPTARRRCCNGWCTTRASSPTSRSSTNPGVRTGPSHATTRLRPWARRLHLPGGQAAEARPTSLQGPVHRPAQERRDPPSRLTPTPRAAPNPPFFILL